MDNTPNDWKEPDFNIGKGNLVHEWKLYVDEPVAYTWHTFTEEQKKRLARNFQMIADSEEREQGTVMEWINVKERLPEIEEWEPGCVAGRSDPVLVYCEGFVNDTPVALYQFAVASLSKGGRGDLTSLYWDFDFEPTHWKRLDAPKMKAKANIGE